MTSLRAIAISFALVSAASSAEWRELAPGVWRQATIPAAYVVVDGKEAIGFGAPADLDLASLEKQLDCRVETVLLTHAHRDSSAAAEQLTAERFGGRKRNVRAPRTSEPWLSPAGVTKFWADSLVMSIENPPLKHRRWALWQYFVPAYGVHDVRFDLSDGDVLHSGKWTIKIAATPGHSPDHTSYLATHSERPDRVVFCGDAFFRTGKLWTPFTTDWHHQQPDGLNATAESLRRLGALQPTLLCPEHGAPVAEKIDAALARTAEAVRRAAVAKGYETWLAASGRKVPDVKFLAPEQVGSANADGNTKPWTKLSPHLYLSGNTYAIASRDGPVLLVDPYHRGLPAKLAELKRDHGVGPVEALTISHAHNDHYTGVFAFPEKERPPVWALDHIAYVIAAPHQNRAPYVDPRSVDIAKLLKDGEEVAWREYRLKFHHLPGQTEYAMGLELTIDSKHMLFTGDNFYRADQYSGSGGWSGHNRGLPAGYVRSIEKILAMKPDWILAEHGGAIEYSADDFAARLAWAKEAAAAADALSASGDHRREWNPHGVEIEMRVITQRADAESALSFEVQLLTSAADEPTKPKEMWLRFAPNDVFLDQAQTFPLKPTSDGRLFWPGTRIRPGLSGELHIIPAELGFVGEPPLPIDAVMVLDLR